VAAQVSGAAPIKAAYTTLDGIFAETIDRMTLESPLVKLFIDYIPRLEQWKPMTASVGSLDSVYVGGSILGDVLH
jgi:hypothetical protein